MIIRGEFTITIVIEKKLKRKLILFICTSFQFWFSCKFIIATIYSISDVNQTPLNETVVFLFVYLKFTRALSAIYQFHSSTSICQLRDFHIILNTLENHSRKLKNYYFAAYLYSMFPLIIFFCLLCADILVCAHFLREFTQTVVSKIQSGFCVRN